MSLRPLTRQGSRRGAASLSATLLVLAAIALPNAAFGAAKGIQTDMTWGVSNGDQQTDANLLRDVGAQWTRLTVSWHDAEPTRGSYSSSYLSAVDRAVSLSQGAGVHVLLDIYEAPQWASGTSNKNAPPQNPQDYANFAKAMAQRYAGKAEAIEVWNEENIGQFWNGSPSAPAYAQLLKTAYPAIKAGNPGVTVLFGGMSTNDWQFLSNVYGAAPDIGHYFDVMATHPYTPQAPPDAVTWDDPQHIDRMSFSGYRTVRQVMLDHGDVKPIWFTEFGWATTSQPGWGVSAQQQADYTKLAWQCVQPDAYVQVAILYELRNNYWAHDADDWEDQLGLVTSTWAHKPAYDAFKSIDPNQGGCGYGGSSGTTGTSPPSSSTGTSGTATTSTGSTGTKAKRHKVTVRVRRKHSVRSAGARKRVVLSIFGRVAGANSGRVLLRFERKKPRGGWRKVLSMKARVGSGGRFQHPLKARTLGRWRVRAEYITPPAPAKSRFAYFRL
jgi:polysaccharide biosynthesis protein PslG